MSNSSIIYLLDFPLKRLMIEGIIKSERTIGTSLR